MEDRKLSKIRTITSYELSWWHRGDTKREVRNAREAKRRYRRAVRRNARNAIAEQR